MASASPLSPTFYGHIGSTQDALLLFEACLSGALNHVARRPHDRERVSLIKSGNVFIYEEHSSGIKRWTDGVPWSPSRILGNFLVYRELERPFPPGEKKRAMKRCKRSPGITKQDSFTGLSHGLNGGYTSPNSSSTFDSPNANPLSKETERSLIGSLIDSYGFKEEGLVKKTVSVTIGGVSHHLVSYYTVADVMNNKFSTPSKDPRFQHITVRPDLLTKQNFRTPIDEVDSMDRMDDRSVYANYPYSRNGYEMTNQTMAHRPMSLPTPPISYGSSSSMYSNCGVSPHSAAYEGLPQSAPNSAYGSHFAPSPGLYPSIKQDSYEMGGYRQRYNSVIGIGADGRMGSEGARSHMPPLTSTSYARRPSNYEGCSIDSGISGMSSSSSESKFPAESQYAPHGYYGAGMRESSSSSQNYTPHRALPTPTQQTFDRPPHSGYSTGDNLWSLGSTGSGHGNFITPQWAGTGSS